MSVKYLCGYYVVTENGRESHYRADMIDGMNGEITGKIARLEQQLRDLEEIARYRRHGNMQHKILSGLTIKGAPDGFKTNGHAFKSEGDWYIELSNGQQIVHWGASIQWIKANLDVTL